MTMNCFDADDYAGLASADAPKNPPARNAEMPVSVHHQKDEARDQNHGAEHDERQGA